MSPLDDEEIPGVPEWVVTYGDMMSLLLTFFIMLVSLAEIRTNEGSTRRMMDGIRQAFGPTKFSKGVPGRSRQESSIFNKQSSTGRRSRGGTNRGGRDSQGFSGDNVAVNRLRQGTQIVLGGNARFGRFDATLTDALKQDLDIIARVVGPKPNMVMIRGHASPEPVTASGAIAAAALGGSLPWKNNRAEFLMHDGLPIRDRFDLSFARARAVAEYLVSKKIDRKRLVVTAAGDAEPRVVTRQRNEQRWNRRVDVFLLDTYISPPPKPK